MKVVHFIDGLRVGGKERQAVAGIKALLQRTDLDLLVVSMGRNGFYSREIEEVGVPVRYCPRRVRWDPAVFWRLYRILSSFSPRIIHTNDWVTSFYALPPARLLGAKLVNGSIRNAFRKGGWKWRAERWLLLASDIRLANSAAGLRSRGLPEDSARNWVIRNLFDPSLFPEAKCSDRGRLFPSRKKVIGMVASFKDHKDYGTFFKAAARLIEKRKDVLFAAVGGGENLSRFERQARSLGEQVRLFGEQKDVLAIVEQFDIGVLCTYTEGISNSVMEYMALSKPVIVSDGGGSRELVEDGVSGFLIPPRNAAALIEKVEFLLDHPQAAQRMGAAGRARLEDEFSAQRFVDQTMRLYAFALGLEESCSTNSRAADFTASRKGAKL